MLPCRIFELSSNRRNRRWKQFMFRTIGCGIFSRIYLMSGYVSIISLHQNIVVLLQSWSASDLLLISLVYLQVANFMMCFVSLLKLFKGEVLATTALLFLHFKRDVWFSPLALCSNHVWIVVIQWCSLSVEDSTWRQCIIQICLSRCQAWG